MIIQELIASWRNGAKQCREMIELNGNDEFLGEGRRVLRECADELEAVMASLATNASDPATLRQLADQVDEGRTVLDEPFHREAVGDVLVRASTALREAAASLEKLKQANKTDPVKRLHNLVDGLQYCDLCEAKADGEDDPNVLCGACLTRLQAAEASRDEALAYWKDRVRVAEGARDTAEAERDEALRQVAAMKAQLVRAAQDQP